MKTYVFASHASDDAEKVRHICKLLENYNVSVWASFKDIVPGTEWDRAIQEALEEASHVIVFVSQKSVNSSYVRAEVEYGLDNNKVVLPVLLEKVKLPVRWHTLQYIDTTILTEQYYIWYLSKYLPKTTFSNLKNLLQTSGTFANIRASLLFPNWLIKNFIGGSTYGASRESNNVMPDCVTWGHASIKWLTYFLYLCSPYVSPITEKDNPSDCIQSKLELAARNIKQLNSENPMTYVPIDNCIPDIEGIKTEIAYTQEINNGQQADMMPIVNYAIIYIVAGRTSHYSSSVLKQCLNLMTSSKEHETHIISYDYLIEKMEIGLPKS